MDASRWERAQALFHKICDISGQEQLDALAEGSAGDQPLYDEVLAMLASDRKQAGLLDEGVEQLAGQVIGQSAAAAAQYKSIGAYEIQSVLGEGGMGTVFLGKRADLGSVAAIKVLRDAWISPARRERFAAEQRTLAQLDHQGRTRTTP
jgi:serine/threonine-protein kinase